MQEQIKTHISSNLIVLRKRAKLTQAELADHLNYSDKSISKWERAEGVPDIYVISELCTFFNVSIDRFVNEEIKELTPLVKKYRAFNRHDFHVALFSLSITWVAILLIYVTISLITQKAHPILFIYALPITAFVWYILSKIRKLLWYGFATLSVGIWTSLLAIYLSLSTFSTSYLFFIVGIPIQILVIAIYAHKYAKEVK